ncbi:PIN domain-containing protein [Kitasatospora purpeofusca]|uniref:PIN-like domain-containing protein n=1 Tax=Kitasatospora purpeofusca TaxID=67352 RepID=UPI002E111A42|nr:PIN domain-containing protein [Kitasatospora purpeofusca]
MATKHPTNEAQRPGLFTDFDAYRTPVNADYASVLTKGLVAFDANVLLNLYRYTQNARSDLLRALEALDSSLFVPHQVLVEFWRNRETTLRESGSTGAKAVEEMNGHLTAATQTLRTWANRVALEETKFEGLKDQLAGTFEQVRQKIDGIGEGEWKDITHDTSTDPVVVKLEAIFSGRVGPALDAEDYEAALKEGMRRVENKVPPGYMDRKKEGSGPAGDYLVWEQILKEAGPRACDVLFVTADAKEDWWRKEHGYNRGPRPELTDELSGRGGGRLLLLTPKRFLEIAAPIFEFSVSEGSVQDIERVERIEDEETNGGWTTAALRELFDRLTYEGWLDRVSVIKYAASHDGFVDAETVYELCEYEDDRTLRGFTKPVTRISRDLRKEPVSEDAVKVLTTKYRTGQQRAVGFLVPAVLLPMIREITDGDDDGA